MGYACPVCDAPQRDAEHLANHLAFTAMLRGGDHETWLDDRVPDWGERSPADLGEAVEDEAVETEYEEVFEDTVHRGAGPGGKDSAGGHHQVDEHHWATGAGDAHTEEDGRDRETEEVLREARALTRQMTADDAEEPDAAEGLDDEGNGLDEG